MRSFWAGAIAGKKIAPARKKITTARRSMGLIGRRLRVEDAQANKCAPPAQAASGDAATIQEENVAGRIAARLLVPVPPASVVARLSGRRIPILDAGAADPAHDGKALIESHEQATGDAAAVGILSAPRVPGTRRARARVARQSH